MNSKVATGALIAALALLLPGAIYFRRRQYLNSKKKAAKTNLLAVYTLDGNNSVTSENQGFGVTLSEIDLKGGLPKLDRKKAKVVRVQERSTMNGGQLQGQLRERRGSNSIVSKLTWITETETEDMESYGERDEGDEEEEEEEFVEVDLTSGALTPQFTITIGDSNDALGTADEEDEEDDEEDDEEEEEEEDDYAVDVIPAESPSYSENLTSLDDSLRSASDDGDSDGGGDHDNINSNNSPANNFYPLFGSNMESNPSSK
jgi:hypothetical protein